VNAILYNVLSRVMCVTIDGVLDWILDLLTTYTHDSKLQAITAPSLISTIHKSSQHPLSIFQPAMSSPAVPRYRLVKSGDSSASRAQASLHRLPYRTDSVAPIVFKITPRHGPRRNTRFQHTLVRRFVAVGMCLPSCCLEMSLVYSPTSRSLHSNGSTRYSIVISRLLPCSLCLFHTGLITQLTNLTNLMKWTFTFFCPL
jgi:hypothetical protein